MGAAAKVKVHEANPDGPLAGLVRHNDCVLSVNGVACDQGHLHAARLLKHAPAGEVELAILPRRTRRLSRPCRR